jgi:hypothetical protein
LFLVAMIVALIVEAALCLPKLSRQAASGVAGDSASMLVTEHRPLASHATGVEV